MDGHLPRHLVSSLPNIHASYMESWIVAISALQAQRLVINPQRSGRRYISCRIPSRCLNVYLDAECANASPKEETTWQLTTKGIPGIPDHEEQERARKIDYSIQYSEKQPIHRREEIFYAPNPYKVRPDRFSA